jgi:peptidyl-prolyl cis-trans isomerase SurA
MATIVKFTGADNNVQVFNFRSAMTAFLLTVVSLAAACGGTGTTGPGGVDMNESAATVNGKAIKFEEVERAVKQQAQGQESKLSALELASARLQVLQTLIEQEVMFQKAEKEGTVPSDEEITAEINKQKTQSGKSADQIQKEMQESGLTDAALHDQVKKALAIQKLVDKITGRIEPPKDSEIEAFYNGNKDAFVKKRGVKLAAIVIDPANNGEGDTTVDEQTSVLKANDIIKRLQAGQEFSTLAQQFSEDQSRLQGGDLGYVSEADMRQSFPEQLTATLMSPQSEIGKIYSARMMGKLYILKLQDRSDRDEQVTLDSPGVRQQVADQLVNSRKQLLAASYQAIAMNEARVENYLAKKVVDNPNELSGARPAPAAGATTTTTPPPTNGTVTNMSNSNSNSPANTEPTPRATVPAATPAARATTPAARPSAPATSGNTNRPQ